MPFDNLVTKHQKSSRRGWYIQSESKRIPDAADIVQRLLERHWCNIVLDEDNPDEILPIAGRLFHQQEISYIRQATHQWVENIEDVLDAPQIVFNAFASGQINRIFMQCHDRD